MSRKIFLFFFILLVFAAIFMFLPQSAKQERQVVSYKSPLPSSALPDSPKQIEYDKDTDLNKELETINPEIYDSDFE